MIWPFRRRIYRRRRHWWTLFPRLWRGTVWLVRVLVLLFIVDLFYLASDWPDWKRLARGAIPQSNFIIAYKHQLKSNKQLPGLRWYPVPYSGIPEYVGKAAIVAEDSRFYQHEGFDLVAFREAMDCHGLQHKRGQNGVWRQHDFTANRKESVFNRFEKSLKKVA